MSLFKVTNKELISIYNMIVKIYACKVPNRSIVKVTTEEYDLFSKLIKIDKSDIEDEMAILCLNDSNYRLLFIGIDNSNKYIDESKANNNELAYFPITEFPSIFRSDTQDIIIPFDNRIVQNCDDNIAGTILSIFKSILFSLYTDKKNGGTIISNATAYLFTSIIFNIEDPNTLINNINIYLTEKQINTINIYLSKLFSAGCVSQSNFINAINICLLNPDVNATIGIIRDCILNIYIDYFK